MGRRALQGGRSGRSCGALPTIAGGYEQPLSRPDGRPVRRSRSPRASRSRWWMPPQRSPAAWAPRWSRWWPTSPTGAPGTRSTRRCIARAQSAAAQELADRLLALADEDAEAFAGFGVAMKLAARDRRGEGGPHGGHLGGGHGAATLCAVQDGRRRAPGGGRLAEALAGRSNKNASSDLEVASTDGRRGVPSRPPPTSTSTCRASRDEDLARDLLERTEGFADADRSGWPPRPAQAGPRRRVARAAA